MYYHENPYYLYILNSSISMSSFNTYLEKIQALTDKNLQILSLINSAFYSNNEHVSAIINDETYTIPSFLHIENKLNDLEGNWKRLVDSPLRGEASFVLDGSTRKIQIAGFETQPPAVDNINNIPDHFSLESNDVFKDFITPLLYLNMDVSGIPDFVSEVNVRKVILKSQALKSRVDSLNKEASATISTDWTEASSLIDGFTEDIDYVMYDKVYRLPLRTVDYDGKFIVNDISVTQRDGGVYWDAVIDNYTYRYDNGSMTADLNPGDILLSSDASCKFKVISIDYNAKLIELVVVDGYVPAANNTSLRLFIPEGAVSNKYIKIPLEEDSHVMIFISPINSSTNTGAMWKGGMIVWTDNLTDSNGNTFKSIYNSQVKNLGDILYDLTSFIRGTLSNLSEDELNTLTNIKPTLTKASDSESGDYDVVLLNDHLLDNNTIETIRRLNQEKAALAADIQVLANEIQEIKSQLGDQSLSDQDPTSRENLQSRLDTLNKESATKTSQLMSKITEISRTAEDATLPASNAKYVIRGAVPTDSIEAMTGEIGAKVIKVDILYRYKNVNRSTSNATAVSDMLTVGDWNKYIIDYRQKIASWSADKNNIIYNFESSIGDDNTAASWRTFNIPIQQGETVDMRVRVVWDLGYPYVSVVSGWCDVMNVEFPDNLIKYADVKTIVSSNTEDANDNIVKQELLSAGVTEHVNDAILDQGLTYFHRPESISSGFYTEDSRRVISLRDKLQSMNDSISYIEQGAFGNNYKNLQVTLSDTYTNAVNLIPESSANAFYLPAWNEIPEGEGGEKKKYTIILTIANINQNSPLNIYSMFPGDLTIPVSGTPTSKFDWDAYSGLTQVMDVINNKDANDHAQHYGQVIYFRLKSKWDGSSPFKYNGISGSNLSMTCTPVSWDNIQTPTGVPGDSYALSGGTALAIPLTFNFKFDNETGQHIEEFIAFDIWTSPFADPITYMVKIIADYESRGIKRISEAIDNSKYSPVIRKPINSAGKAVITNRGTVRRGNGLNA